MSNKIIKEKDDSLTTKNVFENIDYPKEVYVVAIWAICFISIVSVIGVIVLSSINVIYEKNISYEGLLALASASVGGLVGIFSRGSNSS